MAYALKNMRTLFFFKGVLISLQNVKIVPAAVYVHFLKPDHSIAALWPASNEKNVIKKVVIND